MKPILLLIIIFSSFLGLFSQNETGIRPSNSYFGAHGLNQKKLTYQQIFPIIRNIPPVDTIMPIEVKNAYLVVDSLAKLLTTQTAITFIKNLQPDSDTMKYIMKYLYLLQEYDYVRFEQYLAEVNYNILGRYTLNLYDILYPITMKMNKSNDSQKYRRLSLIDCGIIVKGVVVKIDSMKPPIWYRSHSDSGKYKHYNLTLNILDSLKGTILPMTVHNTLKQKEELQSFSFPTFHVEFGQGALPQIYDNWGEDNSPYRLVDFTMLDQHKRMLRFRLGDTAIIFLNNVETMSNREYDYLRLCLKNFYGYPVFPVRNGMVRDVNRIWSNDEFTPYETWKNTFNNVKNSIKGFGE